MKEIARRGGRIWALIGMAPIAFIVALVGDSLAASLAGVVALALQGFGCLLIAKYPEEIFNQSK